MIEFLSAVLLVSRDPERLAQFYREVLGMPLQEESHGDSAPHYGCELGDVHFAIHPVENFEGDLVQPQNAVRLAFTVFDMSAFIERLRESGIKPLYEPSDAGFAVITALRDPDGNYIEFTQLADRWYQHLERRRAQGSDMLAKWRSRRVT